MDLLYTYLYLQINVSNAPRKAPPQSRGRWLGLWFDRLTTLSLSKGRDGGVFTGI